MHRIFLIAISLSLLAFAYIPDSTGVPMRDSVNLGTDLYFPSTIAPPWPSIIQRTPYGRYWDPSYISVITDVLGYALIVQNLRGYGDSEGEPSVFLNDAWGDLQDGYDAIEWIAGQSWSNDEIAMFGGSAHGITQYMAAGALPPHLVCCAPMVAGPSLYHHSAFPGGEFRKALVETWLNNLGTPWLIDSVCKHPNYDSLCMIVDLGTRYDSVSYPMFHIGGWYDLYTDGTLEAFSNLESRFHNQKILIGPWGHGPAWGSRYQGDLVYPANAEMNQYEFMVLLFQWYNYWLQDSSPNILTPKVRFYLMGDCDTQDTTRWNRWIDAETWPLPGIENRKYYINANNALDTVFPTGNAIDTFFYDPNDPCPSYGGREYIGLSNGYGPIDQRPIENRADVLVFTSAPLDTPLTIVGRLEFLLFAASDCYDTDWTVRLTDVYPDGRSILVTDNILMSRHRHGFDRVDSLVPNVLDTFNVDLWSIAQTFNTGHSIRIIMSSSNYPRFEKNPNTGAPFQRDDPVMMIARQQVYRSNIYASHLILPVLNDTIPAVTEHHRPVVSNRLLVQRSFNKEVLFDCRNGGNLKVKVYNAAGRQIWAEYFQYIEPGIHVFTLPEIPAGIYFVQIITGQEKHTGRFVVLE